MRQQPVRVLERDARINRIGCAVSEEYARTRIVLECRLCSNERGTSDGVADVLRGNLASQAGISVAACQFFGELASRDIRNAVSQHGTSSGAPERGMHYAERSPPSAG
jgi:hypothetical protein